jgi:hypothetical protein
MENIKNLLIEFGFKEVEFENANSTQFIYSNKISAKVQQSFIEVISESDGNECLSHKIINHTGPYTDENLSNLETYLTFALSLKKNSSKGHQLNSKNMLLNPI